MIVLASEMLQCDTYTIEYQTRVNPIVQFPEYLESLFIKLQCSVIIASTPLVDAHGVQQITLLSTIVQLLGQLQGDLEILESVHGMSLPVEPSHPLQRIQLTCLRISRTLPQASTLSGCFSGSSA